MQTMSCGVIQTQLSSRSVSGSELSSNHISVMLAGVFALICSMGMTAEALQYRIEALGTLGGSFSRARSINNNGQIVGESYTSGGVEHGFSWQSGAISDLGTSGGIRSRAMDLNSQGHAVGWSNNASGTTSPALWKDGQINELPTLGTAGGGAWGINDHDAVVGNAYVASAVYHAALWGDGNVTDLGTLGGTYSIAYDINLNGQIVGGADDSSGKQKACLWSDGDVINLGNLSNGTWDTARGINNQGQVILWGKPQGSTNNHAGLWGGGAQDEVIDLGTFGGEESWAYGLNNAGSVVGRAEFELGNYHAFVYDDAMLIDLGTLGGLFSSAYGINDSGTIAGYAQNSQGYWQAVRWIPMPEPYSLVLFLSGIIILFMTRKNFVARF